MKAKSERRSVSVKQGVEFHLMETATCACLASEVLKIHAQLKGLIIQESWTAFSNSAMRTLPAGHRGGACISSSFFRLIPQMPNQRLKQMTQERVTRKNDWIDC